MSNRVPNMKHRQERSSITPKDFGVLVSKSDYFLRANFQRDFIWKPESISELMDTYCKGGSINAGIMLWITSLKDCNCPQYSLPTEVNTMNEKFGFTEIDKSMKSEEDLNAEIASVIDGQQKAISTKILFNRSAKLNGEVACINIIGMTIINFLDDKISVKFKKEEDIRTLNDKSISSYWIRTCDIVNMSENDIDSFELNSSPFQELKETNPEKYNEILERCKNILFECSYHINNNETITLNKLYGYNYDMAYTEFVKANDTGIALSPQDLLIGKIEGRFPGFRQKLEVFRKNLIGFHKNRKHRSAEQKTAAGYEIKTEELLYAITYTHGLPFGITYDKITEDDIRGLSNNFDRIVKSISCVFKTMSDRKLGVDICKSFDALLPLFQYTFKSNSYFKKYNAPTMKNIETYVYLVSFLELYEHRHTTNVLDSFTKFLSNNLNNLISNNFDMKYIKTKWNYRDSSAEVDVCINPTRRDIEKAISRKVYSSKTLPNVRSTFILQRRLERKTLADIDYTWDSKNEIDHMQCKNLFIDTNSSQHLVGLGVSPSMAWDWITNEKYNRIGNLHILNSRLNKSKGKDLFELWWARLSEDEKAGLRLHNFIPEDKEYTIKNWDEVVAYREKYLIDLFVDNLCEKH